MTNLSDEELRGLRDSYQGMLDDANKAGNTFAPVGELEKAVRALNELVRRREGRDA